MISGFHPLANQELTDAARFYEAQATGLGSRFLDEIERLLSVLEMHPELGRLTKGNLRALSTRRFPYRLVYRGDSDRLLIVAVAHHRRKPHYWTDRLT